MRTANESGTSDALGSKAKGNAYRTRNRSHEEDDEKPHRVERSYGAFERTVRLPAPVDAGKVTATFKNGLLTATLPKTAAAKGIAVPVKAA